MKIDDRQLTISELIKKLEGCSPSYDIQTNEETPKNVMFDFGYMSPDNVHSYRGYYEDIAIGYRHLDEMDKVMNVTDVIDMLKQSIDVEFHGYKGGGYTMRENTPVWVAKYDEATGTGVIGVKDSYVIFIETANLD